MRLVGALTALVTVWCLGCSAFEPLIEHALGRGAGMVCASEASVGMSQAATSAAARRVAVVSSGADANDRALSTVAAAQDRVADGYSCGCQSCHSASPSAYAVLPPAMAAPQAHVTEPTSLLGIERQPLVPPPQRVL
jgi:hypothetical protein